MAELTPNTIKRGGHYNWKNQPERLVYIRKRGSWHQFRKADDRHGRVWCEVLDEDLHMLEETLNEAQGEDDGAVHQ